jgi:hypothetical protein
VTHRKLCKCLGGYEKQSKQLPIFLQIYHYREWLQYIYPIHPWLDSAPAWLSLTHIKAHRLQRIRRVIEPHCKRYRSAQGEDNQPEHHYVSQQPSHNSGSLLCQSIYFSLTWRVSWGEDRKAKCFRFCPAGSLPRCAMSFGTNWFQMYDCVEAIRPCEVEPQSRSGETDLSVH